MLSAWRQHVIDCDPDAFTLFQVRAPAAPSSSSAVAPAAAPAWGSPRPAPSDDAVYRTPPSFRLRPATPLPSHGSQVRDSLGALVSRFQQLRVDGGGLNMCRLARGHCRPLAVKSVVQCELGFWGGGGDSCRALLWVDGAGSCPGA